jgi:hypothetical protein
VIKGIEAAYERSVSIHNSAVEVPFQGTKEINVRQIKDAAEEIKKISTAYEEVSRTVQCTGLTADDKKWLSGVARSFGCRVDFNGGHVSGPAFNLPAFEDVCNGRGVP